MKRVHTSQDALLLNHLRNLLETDGIHCLVKNEFLMGGAGDIPVLDTWPELWVEDSDYARAVAIIDTALKQPLPAFSTWSCPGCGERIEGQFDTCWRCGAARPTR